VSAVYDTELTPSGWTFNIWTVIYIWLSAMIVYIVSGLCRLMISALIFLIMLICTNYSMVGFICHGLHVYGPWLNKYSKVDLWLIRMLVLNGVMIYTTWTTIATLLNLTIVLKYEANMSTADSAFVVENFVLDKHMRYVFIPYIVVIWALSGNMDKNYDASSPSRNGIFIVLLAVSCVLFVTRIVL
uniref:Si:ch211-161h7.5 n=1 Tax=Xiphophorus maculatus TaxID=8083 RepID=M4A525_XIPMA